MGLFFAFIGGWEWVLILICTVGPLAALATLVIYLVKVKKVGAKPAELPPVQPATAGGGETVGNSPNKEEELYAEAAAELEGGNRDEGLWAKCFAECDGDENKAKARYIKARVSRLRDT